MPQSNSLSLNTYTSSQVYSESEDSSIEPTVEDIHEFAKRIGIDPVQESHLLDVAKEGLTQKLPRNWKPCFEPHKKAWYYYNTETQCSQWEHPLDAVYRAKVTQMKADIAMNRLQNFNPASTGPGSGRPSKNLPPLKVRPFLSANSAYLPVPPLIPLPETLGKPSSQAQTPASNSPLTNRLFGPTTNSLLRSQLQPGSQKQPLSILSKATTDPDNNANTNAHLSPPTKEPEHRMGPRKLQPIQQLARKPTGGLTLSGSGASFLKSSADANAKTEESETEGSSTSAETESAHQDQFQAKTSSNLAKGSNEMSPKDPIIRRPGSAIPGSRRILSGLKLGEPQPLQSTLVKTIQRSQALAQLNSNAQAKSHLPWSVNPNSMTDEEKGLWSTLEKAENEKNRSNKPKPSVKFKLDENPELHFELSKSEKQSGESSASEGTDDAFNVNKHSTDEELSAQNQIKTTHQTNVQIRNGVKGETEKGSKTTNVTPVLENEKIERGNQMRDQLEQSLSQLREENEQLITKTKTDLEKYRKSQYEKLKREIEHTLMGEVEKIRAENKRKLEDKRKELAMEFEKDLKSIEMGIKSMDKESVLQHKRDEFMKETEQEIQAEMKELKESLRDEQKKQIQQMKDYHTTFIEKLKQEFAAEDEKIRKEHAASISEAIKELNRDREQLVVALRKQQDVELEELRKEFEQKKKFYQTEIRRLQVHENGDSFLPAALHDLKDPTANGDEMKVIKKSADLESKELELREVKSKYKQLEGKYYRMKQDLHELTSHRINGAKPPRKLVLDELSTVATSADATDDDDHHHQQNDQDRSSSLHDSAISNNSTVPGNDANGEKIISINDIIAGSDVRLNKALSALENLRDQIIEIKSEQEMKLAGSGGKGGGTNKKTSTIRARAAGGKHGANVFPTDNRHNEGLPGPKKASRIRTAVSASDLRKLDNNNWKNKNPRQVVESARDFIKAQKHRLVVSSFNSENTSPSRSHYLHSTFPRLRRIDDLTIVKDGLYSDATTTTNEESSGIGTMYINPVFDPSNRASVQAMPSPPRSQVAQDIDGILVALKHLDKQMKFMWTTVGQKHVERVNNISVLLGDDTAVSSINQYNPTLLTPLIHPVPTNITNPNLEMALNKVKSYKQYLQNGSSDTVSSDFQLPPSLLEKTKDLRQWLENF